MKLKIPAANKVFGKDKKIPKKPSMQTVVLSWLNTEVYEEIMGTEPKLSPHELKVTGLIHIEVPFEGYYEDQNSFKRIVKAQLVPLGYDVEFTYDGTGMGRDICIIKWEHTL
jgi:hypothetical protein